MGQRWRWTPGAAALAGMVCLGAVGQQPASEGKPVDPPPSYDVSTVKLNESGKLDTTVNTNLDHLQTINVPLKNLLAEAFHIQRGLVFGLPPWAEKARYDISAKVIDATPADMRALTNEQRENMMRDLLINRFALKTHFEMRPMPDYELVLAKGGAKLAVSSHGERDADWSRTNTDLTANGIPLSGLTNMLSDQLEKPVVDKTGLGGRYDFHLQWSREQPNPTADAGLAADAPPPLFTALQEQLGLRLQAGKDPVRVLVIDSVTQPAAN